MSGSWAIVERWFAQPPGFAGQHSPTEFDHLPHSTGPFPLFG